MKTFVCSLGFLTSALTLLGQGILVYDQQSSTDETPYGGGGSIQQYTALGQSFTPSLSAVQFVRLKLYDANPGNGLGATLRLDLRYTDLAGAVIDSTTPVFLPDGFAGTADFYFPTAVPVTPGNPYLFQTIVQSGDTWNIDVSDYLYPRGSVFYNNNIAGGGDIWFREGVLVPEPSVSALLILGAAARLTKRKKPRRSLQATQES